MIRLFRTLAGLLLWAALCGSGRLEAQEGVQELWLIPDSGEVVVELPTLPSGSYGFHVYRAGPAEDFVRLTEAPVEPVRSPAEFLLEIGDVAPQIMDRMQAVSEEEMVRRLLSAGPGAAIYGILFPPVARAQGRVFRDTLTEGGGPYRYRVAFVGPLGEENGESREGQVVVEDRLPATPGSLEVEPLNSRVRLQWSYPVYDGDPRDVTVGYHVYRAEADSDVFRRVTDGPLARNDLEDPVWVDRDVLNGSRYRYVVRALDMLGRLGAPTAPVEVTPADPAPPRTPLNLTALPGDDRVELLWQRSAELDVVGYRLERSPGLAAPFETLTDSLLPADSPRWADTTVVGGRQYFYRVVAVDADGQESAPSNPSSTVPRDTRPPPPPTNLEAVVEERAVMLSWAPSSGPGLAGYHIYRAEGRDNAIRVTRDPVTGTTFREAGEAGEGLVPGAEYLVMVAAVDSLGNESERAESPVVIPDDEAPEPPSTLWLTNPTGREVEVRWNASPALDVAGYEVVRATVGSGQADWADTVSVTDRRRLRDDEVEEGRLYRYRITAFDDAGNRSTPLTDSIRFADRSPPPAPNFAQAVAGPAGVRIIWERVAAPDLAAYRVYRSSLPTGRWEGVSELIPAGAERTFLDPDGDAGLFYRVVSVDTSGNESETGAVAQAEEGS